MGVTPDPLLKKPKLNESLLDLERAFWLLAQSRPIGMGAVSGITTCDILAFAKVEGWEPTRFLRAIRAADGVFISHVAKQAEAQANKK